MTGKTHIEVGRRKVLKTIAGIGTIAIAGCSGSSNDPEQGSAEGDTGGNLLGSDLIRSWDVDGVDLVVELRDPEKVADLKLRGPDGEYKFFAAGGADNTNDDYATSMFEQSHDVTGERTRLPLVQTDSGDASYDYSKTTYEPGPQTIVAVNDSGDVLDEVTTDPIQPDIEIIDIGYTEENGDQFNRPDNLAPYIEITNNGSGPTYIRAAFQERTQTSNGASDFLRLWVRTPLGPNEATTEYTNIVGTNCSSGGTRTVPVGVVSAHGNFAVDVRKTFEIKEVESGTWTTERCTVKTVDITNNTYQFQGEISLKEDGW